MPNEKNAGSTAVLLLKLLEEKDMYGYEMMEALTQRSNQLFHLKAGTLYPILHGLEKAGWIASYEQDVDGRTRKYYHLTKEGKKEVSEQTARWERYAAAVNQILKGGVQGAGV